ncbi:MAG: DUF819 family protein, partial [Gemmatimonadota bacterium]
PVWLARLFAPIPPAVLEMDGAAAAAASEPEEHHPFFLRESVSTLDLAKIMAAGLLLLAAADLTARGLGVLAAKDSVPGWVGEIPSVLWLTTFALILGHTRSFHRPAGAMQLGTLALHFFFVVIGIWSRFSEIAAVGVEVFFYTLVVVGVHGVVVYGLGRLVRLDVASLSVASQAAVGGPSSALAVAVSREWPGLVLPGIIVGLVGYAVGNYLGFGMAYLVRGLGIGL